MRVVTDTANFFVMCVFNTDSSWLTVAVVGKTFSANLVTAVVEVVADSTVAVVALHAEVAVPAAEYRRAMPKQYP